MLYAEYLKLFFVKADTSEHKSVALESLYGVDTHTAHHFLDLVIPRMNKIYKTLITDVGVKTLYKVGTLCCDTPVALARLTASAKVTAERQQSGCADITSVCTECDSLYHVRA